MSETVQRDEDLLRLISGYMPAFTIGAALRLGILESVGEAGMTADELARVTSTHAPSLTRVLRALAALGVLAEDSPGTFRRRSTRRHAATRSWTSRPSTCAG
jgi:hypothetical protein